MADLGATRIGVNYRSEIDYTLAGSVSFGNRPAQLAAALPDGPVTAKTTMPASASLSVFHALSPTVDLLADLTWTGWSSFDKLAIVRTSGALVGATPENWDDTLRYSVGINYKPGGAWTWRAGIAYDETPVPDRYRTPRIPDQNRTWLALGGQFRIDRANAVDFGYAHLFVPNADMSASVNNTAPGAGVLRGEYDNAVDILSAQYTHTF
jgi:long-chain fatty acid transport protein